MCDCNFAVVPMAYISMRFLERFNSRRNRALVLLAAAGFDATIAT